MTAATRWVLAGTLDELWEGEMRRATVGGTNLLLCNIEGEVFAYEDRCPHLARPLSEGRLDGPTLICAAHEWTFELRTGRGVNPANSCLRHFAVQVDDEAIMVDLAEPCP
ncbi:MAG: toluene monooxygenase system ferredoxin subunit [Acidimicrobiia bacterium]|nr:toluene monooxygenase system ferredoxin subunit [Acidimicrobiia bacterium]